MSPARGDGGREGEGLRERLAYAAYATGWALVRRLPERAAYRAFQVGADLVWRRRGPGVRQLEANLRRAVPGADEAELRALSRAGMRSYLRYWCDVFRLPDWDHERTVGSVRTEDEHRLRDAYAAGRGVVVALPHTGNWDHAGAWAGRTGLAVTTVAERLRPERLFERFVAFRRAIGIEVLPLTGGGDVSGLLADRLRAGAVVPLLADRDLRASGIPVTLLGEPTRFPPGPALLALRTGAVLLPVVPWFEGRTLVLTFAPPVQPPPPGPLRGRVAAATQQVADAFSEGIRAHPQDWHMLQPLWDADRPAPVGERGPRAGERG